MNTTNLPDVATLINKHEALLLKEWLKEQEAAVTLRRDLLDMAELEKQSTMFLASFRIAIQQKDIEDIEAGLWDDTRNLLQEISASRARLGFTPSETATFIFSLKQPVFTMLRKELEEDPLKLTESLWWVTAILDKLGLYTIESFQQVREQIIQRQSEEILELATPVVKVWDSILMVPLIGTLDSNRTQMVMESLLQRIVDTTSRIAIIDITGVPTVDTLTAQHLLKTVTAARLMGSECIISGIRPNIAQTIVHLGVTLGDVVTKSTMAEALAEAFKKINIKVT